MHLRDRGCSRKQASNGVREQYTEHSETVTSLWSQSNEINYEQMNFHFAFPGFWIYLGEQVILRMSRCRSKSNLQKRPYHIVTTSASPPHRCHLHSYLSNYPVVYPRQAVASAYWSNYPPLQVWQSYRPSLACGPPTSGPCLLVAATA